MTKIKPGFRVYKILKKPGFSGSGKPGSKTLAITINGVLKLHEEDTSNIVKKLFEYLKVEDSTNMIVNCYRMNSKSTPIAPIVVLLKDKSNVHDIVSASLKTNVTNRDIGFDTQNRIFVNEMLSSNCYQLLKKAKCLRNHGYKFVWTRYGKVFVKKEEGAAAVRILSMTKIDELMI